MKYFYSDSYIQDGKLDNNCGRIIIFKNKIMLSFGITQDHNYLLRAFSSKFNMNKDDVISNGSRFYFKQENKRFIITGVRKIDNEDFENKKLIYTKLIKNNLK